MPDDNYALEAATRLNEIGFAEFTSDLITKTFDALVDANLRQTESYIDLVKEVSKTLTTYINDTKLEISNQEVLDYLGSLPKFVDDTGQQVVDQATASAPAPTPISLVAGEQVKPADLNVINKGFTAGQLASNVLQIAGKPEVTTLLKDALGLVRTLVPSSHALFAKVFPAASANPDFYDPVAFKQDFLAASNPGPIALNDAAIAKLYDSVAEVIAGDKYALLQEMVKLGVVRILPYEGRIQATLSFSTFERESKSSSSYEKHAQHVNNKYKQRQAPSRGILRLIRNRPLEKTKKKERDIHVQTTTEQSSSSQGTTISIFGGVEIRFKTDYLPVAQA